MNTPRIVFWLALAALAPAISFVQSDDNMPYATVDEAMADLTAMPDVKISQQDGWTVISSGDHEARRVIWTFVPQGHYAYPAAARREALLDNQVWSVNTSLLCGNTVPACEQLRKDFDRLDMQIRATRQEAAPDAGQPSPDTDH